MVILLRLCSKCASGIVSDKTIMILVPAGDSERVMSNKCDKPEILLKKAAECNRHEPWDDNVLFLVVPMPLTFTTQ